jgi:hypothetical protein|tara:strand:+ start:453 stop:587 length:135 start_codon:yes stop_codon:yes gene_type:complete
MNPTFGFVVAGIGGLVAYNFKGIPRTVGLVALPVGLIMVFMDRS